MRHINLGNERFHKMNMTGNSALAILCSFILASCNQKEPVSPIKVGSETAEVSGVSASDIAEALGMKSFPVRIEKDGSYGLSFKHSGGYEGTGYTNFRSGDVLKIIYWIEGDFVKYLIKTGDRRFSGSLSVKNPSPFRSMGSPEAGRVYKAGEIILKWSVNSSSNGNDRVEEGELGLVLVLQGDAVPVQHLNLKPNDNEVVPQIKF